MLGDNFQCKTGEADALSILSTGGNAMGRRGIPLGIRDDGQPMTIDPWNDVATGRIPAPIYLTTGEIKFGKTGLQKLLMYRSTLFAAGERPIRIVVDGFKRNDGVPEYGPIAEAMGAESINLATARLNMFDPAMGVTQSSELAMSRDTVSHLRAMANAPAIVTDSESTALRVSIEEMHRRYDNGGDIPSVLSLLQILNNHAELRPVLPDGTAMNIPRPEFDSACIALMHAFMRLDGGDYGNMIGGTNSLADPFRKRIVSLDFSQINDRERILVQSLLWGWRRAFIQQGMDEFVTDGMFGDENYEMWQYEVYARQMYSYVKQVRMTGGFICLSTHQLGDFESLNEYATGMREHVAGFFMGRTTKIETDRLRARFGEEAMTDPFVEELQNLPKYHFIYYVPGYPPEKFKVVPTPWEMTLIDSDVANRRMLGIK